MCAHAHARNMHTRARLSTVRACDVCHIAYDARTRYDVRMHTEKGERMGQGNAGAFARRSAASMVARDELGDRGETITGYAYAWDTRRDGYNVVRTYASAPDRVTRYLVCERPNGEGRARTIARFPLRLASAHTDSSVRTFYMGDGFLMGDAPRNGVAFVCDALARSDARMVGERARKHALRVGVTRYDAPPRVREQRERRVRFAVPPHDAHTPTYDCTRTHATRTAQDACNGTHVPRETRDVFLARIDARIDARERAA